VLLEKELARSVSNPPDYEEVARSRKFKQLMNERKKFIIPFTIFFIVFYFMLPILTSYTTILNTPVIGDITWVWVYAFAQFVMTWVLSIIYIRKAAVFDKKSNEIIEEQLDKGGIDS